MHHREYTQRSTPHVAPRAAFLFRALVAAAVLLLVAPAAALGADMPPLTPSGLVAIPGPASPAVAQLHWSDGLDDAGIAGYRVWRSIRPDEGMRRIATVATATFTDRTGIAGQDYYYAVSAFGPSGAESPLSPTTGPVRSRWKDSPHTGPDGKVACTSCHANHDGTGRSLLRDTGGTNDRGSACYGCHDGSGAEADIANGPKDSFGLASGHTLRRPGSRGLVCSSCHSPHARSDERPGLNRRTIAGKAVGDSAGDWCLVCHEAGGSTASPVRNADGYPVRGTFPGRAVYTDPAKNAHSRIPTTGPDRSRGDCRHCHAAHRSANAYDGLTETFRPTSALTLVDDQRRGTYAAACLRCHGGNAAWERRGASDISRFVTDGSGPRSENAGHRIKTAGGTLPVGAPLPCYDCHGPHGSARGNASSISDALGAGLRTDTAKGVRAFCLSCHSTSEGRVWDSATATYAPVSATMTVEGLRRDGRVGDRTDANSLKLSAASPSHSAADGTSCSACHGGEYTWSGSSNVHDPSPARSLGGVPCYGCHTSLQTHMEDGQGAKTGGLHGGYKHMLGGALGDGDLAPGADASRYPTSTTEVYCTSCHGDHGRFDGDKAANLRVDISKPASATTSTDFVIDGEYGICVSCHKVALPKREIRPSDASTVTAPVDGFLYATSAHAYKVASAFGASEFRADCSKCHSDDSPKPLQTSSFAFATHYSLQERILATLGLELPASAQAQERICLRCHSSSTSENPNGLLGRDHYGQAAMSPGALDIERLMDLPFGHSTGATVSASTDGGAATTGRSIECADCHDSHSAASGSRRAGRSEAGPALRGAGNVVPTWDARAWTSATDFTVGRSTGATGDHEAYVCLKCHDTRDAGGKTRSGLVKTDLARELNPANAGGHAVLGDRQDWPKTTVEQGLAYDWAFPRDAFTTATVSNMGADYKTACTDCHGSAGGAGRGPHGSGSKGMLVAGGTAEWWKAELGDWGSSDGPMCSRCHKKETNVVHTRRGHQDRTCDSCHARVPHGWKRPRLLISEGDETPYTATGKPTLRAFTARSHTPTDWVKRDCDSACHSADISNAWP